MVGAIMGTKINTVMVMDITCAILLPSYWSRTKAVVTARGADMPTPCRIRPNNIMRKLVEETDIKEPMMNKEYPAYMDGFRPVLSERGPKNN